MRVLRGAREIVAAVKRRPRLLRTIEVAIALAVVVLCVIGIRGEWSKAGPQLENARPGYLGLALGIVAVYYLVFILGWIRILAAWDIHVPYRAALQAEMASMLAKYVPGGVWTPAARVAALGRLTGVTAAGTVLASILVEAVLSAISGVLVFVVSLAWVRTRTHPSAARPVRARLSHRPPPADLRAADDPHPEALRRRPGRAAAVPDDGRAARLLLLHVAHRRARALLRDLERRLRAVGGDDPVPRRRRGGRRDRGGARVLCAGRTGPARGVDVRPPDRRHEQLGGARRDDPESALDHDRRARALLRRGCDLARGTRPPRPRHEPARPEPEHGDSAAFGDAGA